MLWIIFVFFLYFVLNKRIIFQLKKPCKELRALVGGDLDGKEVLGEALPIVVHRVTIE